MIGGKCHHFGLLYSRIIKSFPFAKRSCLWTFLKGAGRVGMKGSMREFPNGPVVRVPCFHCQGQFYPWLGTKIPEAALCGQKQEGSMNNKNTESSYQLSGGIFITDGTPWRQIRVDMELLKFERQTSMLTLSMQDFCRITALSLILLFQLRSLSHMYFIFPFCSRSIIGCLHRDLRVWAYLYRIINFAWYFNCYSFWY